MTTNTAHTPTKNSLNTWLERPVFPFWQNFTVEMLIAIIILAVTIISRFAILGERVMSHDEVNHVAPAYSFYKGEGYQYDPVTHGPFQFHMITLSYYIFGASDFSARIPAALFGIATVVFALFAFKPYLGKAGSLIAGFLLMISPYMLFYSRYTRNEVFIVFWGIAMLWAILRYLELGEKKYLIILTVIVAFHYVDKATSYIFSGEILIFLFILFIGMILRRKWQSNNLKTLFKIISAIAFAALAFALIFSVMVLDKAGAEGVGESSVGVMLNELPLETRLTILVAMIVGILAIAAAVVLLIKGLGMKQVRAERSFDLIVLQLSLMLPLTAALIMKIIGIDALGYSDPNNILYAVLTIVPLFILSALMGCFWNWRVWLPSAGIFWGIFTIFYTSMFTAGNGFAVGKEGALGYWISQQGVQRAQQPHYYYALLQIPVYEFLPALGTFFALLIGSIKGLFFQLPGQPFAMHTPPQKKAEDSLPAASNSDESEPFALPTANDDEATPQADIAESSEPETDDESTAKPGQAQIVPTLLLLLYWSFMSLVAFSVAGERMPWLTTHIALPLILSAAWGLGWLVEKIDWADFGKKHGWLAGLVGLLFLISTGGMLGALLGTTPPFQGNLIHQLQATSTFLLSSVVAIASVVGLILLVRTWKSNNFILMIILAFFGILTGITLRASFRANYINYDNAKEYLVYAHAARGPKDILEKVEDISTQLYGDPKTIAVAYDNDSLYPFWWYFRDFPNKLYFGENPSRTLRENPVIIVGQAKFGAMDAIVEDDYYVYEYFRLWWPMQDYDGFDFKEPNREHSWERIKFALTSPEMRSALWQIWFNRDYTQYANVKGVNTLTLSNWSPAQKMRMYIRKDIAAKLWEYGAPAIAIEPKIDPYEAGRISLEAAMIISAENNLEMNAPRDIAIAPDGTLYVADSRNNRILHLDANGSLINQWGSYANILEGEAPAGTFNEPWGIAVAADGSVYVSDTWNHRIQKFNADGKFITMWGTFGSDTPLMFYGPRGIDVDDAGRVYLADTGNKRILIFSENGDFITLFGGYGFLPGQLDEPCGVAVDHNGAVYVSDTWNQRMQVFYPDEQGLVYYNAYVWQVDAWYGQTLDNKPLIDVDDAGRIYVADPDAARVLVFDNQGNYLYSWGDYGSGANQFGIVGGMAVDSAGNLWVSDARFNRLLYFSVPQTNLNAPSGVE